MSDLFSCVENNDLETLQSLLDAGASPHETRRGDTPMSEAIYMNHVDCAKLLSKYMRPSDPVSTDGFRSVQTCVRFNRMELFLYFLQFENLSTLRTMHVQYKCMVYTGCYEDAVLRRARVIVRHLEVLHMLPQLGLCTDVSRIIASYIDV